MKILIEVLKITVYKDLSELYENKLELPCNLKVGDKFIIESLNKPKGLCMEAWKTLRPFVKRLFDGETKLFDNWLKDERSVIVSCNDGIRPVSFYVRVIEN